MLQSLHSEAGIASRRRSDSSRLTTNFATRQFPHGRAPVSWPEVSPILNDAVSSVDLEYADEVVVGGEMMNRDDLLAILFGLSASGKRRERNILVVRK